MLLSIADILPLESRVAFAMTDHHMVELLSPKSLDELRTADPNLKFKFLRLLERDSHSPLMVACPSCYTIHHSFLEQHSSNLCRISEMHDAVDLSPNCFNRLPTFSNYNIVRAITTY